MNDHFDHIVLNLFDWTVEMFLDDDCLFHNIYFILQVLQKILILDDLFLDELKETV